MSKNFEHDQKALRHLLAFLNRDQSQGVSNNGRLKSIWDTNTQSAGRLRIQSCLEEMLKSNPDNRKIAQQLEPYKDEAIPVLVEAMNLEHTSIYFNAIEILEIIGDYRVIPLIRGKIDKLIENDSVMDLLKSIATREDVETRTLIIDLLIKYLIETGDAIIPLRARRWYEGSVWDIIDSRTQYDPPLRSVINTLIELDELSDPRIPPLLEENIKKFSYKSLTFPIALKALCKIDVKRAALCLETKMDAVEDDFLKRDQKHTRMVLDERNKKPDESFLTICVREQNELEQNEIPYAYKYEKPLVYFLKDGQDTKDYKQLAGRTISKSEFPNVALKYLKKWLPEIDTPNKEYQECVSLLRESLDLSKWGFRQSYILPNWYPTIIYDSEWCRINFSFEGADHPGDTTLHLRVYFGRLHAPSNDSFMIWNGEKCWCWHRIEYALNFLDGLSPEEATKVEYHPRVIEQYRNSEISKTMSAARWRLGMEAEIWKNYGQRLFELFDLRHPELWEKFSLFMKEFQMIKKSNSYGYPTKDKIC